MATKPPEWFTPDSQPLLVEYCQHIIKADELSEALAKFDGVPEDDDRLAHWNKLMDRKEKVARLLATLATKMRLTQQSRWTEQSAATAAKRTAPTGKPWEFGERGAG